MRYFTIWLLTIVSLCLTAGNIQKVTLGYTTGDLENSIKVGSNMSLFIKGAIEFPETTLEKYKGNYISEVSFAVAEDLSEQYNFIFITKDLYSEPIYKQQIDKINKGWNHIKLEKQIEIDGEKLYVGFQYKSSGKIISLDGEENNNLANWLATYQTENEDYGWVHQDGGAHNIQITITGNQLPQNDIKLISVNLPKYVPLDDYIPTTVYIQNNGASDINSLDISFDFGKLGTITKTIEGLNIKNNEITGIPINDIILKSIGVTNCEITIDKINNENDLFPQDNSLTIKNIICKQEYTIRNVITEQFSTDKCSNCPDATKTINRITRYSDNIIKVVHHSGFLTDDLTIPQSQEYLFLYGRSPSTPAIMVDRKNFSQYGANNTEGPVFGIDNNLKNILNQEMNTPAYISVNIDHQYDIANRSLSLKVYGNIPSKDLSKLPGDDIRLNIFITEDSIYGYQNDIDGPIKTYHMNSIRGTITETWGDFIDLSEYKYQSKEYTYTIPDNWNEKNIKIVAFIANYNDKDPNDCNILNGYSTKLDTKGSTAIKTISNEDYIIFNNRSNEICFPEEYDKIIIYNIDGTMIYNSNKPATILNIENWENGVYVISLIKSNHKITRKIFKTHNF